MLNQQDLALDNVEKARFGMHNVHNCNKQVNDFIGCSGDEK